MSTTITEEVTLLDKDGVQDLIERFEGVPEDSQSVVNLLLLTILLSEAVGVELESFYELTPLLRKKALTILGGTE